MPNVGPVELIIVLVIALVLLGPKRLPAAAQSLGRSLNEFRRGLADHQDGRSPDPKPVDAQTTDPVTKTSVDESR
jgi:sec-independent protein translocase protein TatA